MTLYFHTRDGQVVGDDPIELPQNWEHVSSLDALEPWQLANVGWFPAVDVIPEFDPEWEVCRRTGWSIQNASATNGGAVGARVVAAYEIEPKPLDQIKAEAKARVANRRWQAEIGGIEVMGVGIDTSREAQAMLAGANLLAATYPDQVIDWKSATGWVQLSAPMILELSAAVGLHVQACFTRERLLNELIDAADNPAAVRRAEAW